jgi:protocatechuate 3,4-dioxygenase beta subunit
MTTRETKAWGGKAALWLSGALGTALIASCALAEVDQARCIPTEADSLGPFYVAGTAVRDTLNRFGTPGEPQLVEGGVRSSAEGRAPIAGAMVEVWQTDGEGRYFPQDNGHSDDFDDQEVDLRGTAKTDQSGSYRYRTVVPGAYRPRPRHLHYRISAPGHRTLVTQLYITGDGTFRQPGGDCRHAPLEAVDGGYRYGAPTIYLMPE